VRLGANLQKLAPGYAKTRLDRANFNRTQVHGPFSCKWQAGFIRGGHPSRVHQPGPQFGEIDRDSDVRFEV